jgi:hypothetical protein
VVDNRCPILQRQADIDGLSIARSFLALGMQSSGFYKTCMMAKSLQVAKNMKLIWQLRFFEVLGQTDNTISVITRMWHTVLQN